MSRERVWELDALRGLCILGMVVIHVLYDLIELLGVDWTYPMPLLWLKNWGGVSFLLISGICATLGSRNLRRGAVVFACGMLITAVTAAMAVVGTAGRGIVIRFGILHCLGLCMILWTPVRRLSPGALTLLGTVLILLGFWFRHFRISTDPLFPLGLYSPGFRSADYFPLLPNFGFFLLGAVLGKTLYRRKATLFPGVDAQRPVPRFFSACGRHSLLIYLLHQPVIFLLLSLFRKS